MQTYIFQVFYPQAIPITSMCFFGLKWYIEKNIGYSSRVYHNQNIGMDVM